MPLKHLKKTAIAVTLSTIPFQTMAEEPLKPGLMVDMEGAFSETHSTPYVEIIHQNQFYALDWKSIWQMIETQDFQSLPKEKVMKACQKLKKSVGSWPDYYNIGAQTLPPQDFNC